MAGLPGDGEPLLQLLDIPDQLDPLMEQLQLGGSWGAMQPHAKELKERPEPNLT